MTRSIRKRTLRRMLTAVLVRLVILYGIVALLVMLFQRRLIYIPTKLTSDAAASLAASEGFLPWQSANGQLIGWQLPAIKKSNGAVLIVHGNAGSALDRGYIAEPIRDAGSIDVFVLEYPGYGARPGKPSERAFLNAGEEALAALVERTPLFIVSESIGAGVASYLAGKHPDTVTGLALLVPYTSLVEVGKRKMPFLPVAWLLWDRFNPAEWLKTYSGPVAVVIGERDEIIPPELGRQLFEGYSGPKQIEVMAGAGHNDVAVQTPEWWGKVFSFWNGRTRTSHSP